MTRTLSRMLRDAGYDTAQVAINDDLRPDRRVVMLETAAQLYRMSAWVSGEDSVDD